MTRKTQASDFDDVGYMYGLLTDTIWFVIQIRMLHLCSCLATLRGSTHREASATPFFVIKNPTTIQGNGLIRTNVPGMPGTVKNLLSM